MNATNVAAPARLDGHTALVTGAGRGVGRALALGLAELGAGLVLAARSAEQLAETQAAAGSAVSATSVRADLSKEEDVERVIDEARRRNADILINNAAVITPIGATGALAAAEVRAAIALNLTTPLLLTSALLPAMTASGWGRIVNLSTGAVDNPTAMVGGSVYVATKAAIEIATIGLAAEIDGTGVTANVYRPGMVDTGMQESVRGGAGDPVAAALGARFTVVQRNGMLVSAETAARSLIARLAGDDNGAVWNGLY